LILNRSDHFEQDVWVNIKTLHQEITKKIELRVCQIDQVVVPANFSITEGFARYSNSSGVANLQVINFVRNITLGNCKMCSQLSYRLVSEDKSKVLTPGLNDISIDPATNNLHIPTE